MTKFNLTETVENEGTTYYVYQNARYELEVAVSGGKVEVNVIALDKATPQIVTDRTTLEMSVRTSSHGTLAPEALKEMIETYNFAIETITVAQEVVKQYV